MLSYLGLMLLLLSPLCRAMESDESYQGSNKRERKSSFDSSWGSSSAEEDTKKPRGKTQKSVQKTKFYVINFSDTAKVVSSTDKPTLMKSCLRYLAKNDGYAAIQTCSLMKEHRALQDLAALQEHDLKTFYMRCPDPSCTSVLQSDTEPKLYENVFRHWFLTREHQPKFFVELPNFIWKDKKEAIAYFDRHGLPKNKIIPLPSLPGEPMDEGKDEDIFSNVSANIDIGEQGEEVSNNNLPSTSYDTGNNNVPHVASAVDEEAQAWYIIDSNPAVKGSVIAFEAPTREQVVTHFVASRKSKLTVDSQEVIEQGKKYRVHEELVKQLLVQDKKARKNLVCPDEACELMLTQKGEVSEKGLAQLFVQMALHHMQTHPIEQDNILALNATERAATSFDTAYAKMLEDN